MGWKKCCIPGCASVTGRPDGVALFALPTISKRDGDPSEESITSQRREQWLSKVEDPSFPKIFVCSLHFVKGIYLF